MEIGARGAYYLFYWLKYSTVFDRKVVQDSRLLDLMERRDLSDVELECPS